MALIAGTLAEVLGEAWPRRAWTLRSNDAAGLTWHDDGPVPTADEIAAASAGAWLALARRRAAAAIDERAEAERLAIITGGSGQAMVYLEKQREARAAVADPAPDGDAYPLLAASVGVDLDPRTGEPVATLAAAAERVLAVSRQWALAAAAIEGRRLRAKRAVAAAADIAAIEVAMIADGWQVP